MDTRLTVQIDLLDLEPEGQGTTRERLIAVLLRAIAEEVETGALMGAAGPRFPAVWTYH